MRSQPWIADLVGQLAIVGIVVGIGCLPLTYGALRLIGWRAIHAHERHVPAAACVGAGGERASLPKVTLHDGDPSARRACVPPGT
jgi:hypothetical protein